MLDTNLIISGAITPGGVPNQILRAFQRDAFDLLSSPELIEEVADVLSRPHIRWRYRPDDPIVRAILAGLLPARIAPLPLDHLPVHCRDPEDDPLLDCALAGRADYIVTGDGDPLDLDRHPDLGTLRIVTHAPSSPCWKGRPPPDDEGRGPKCEHYPLGEAMTRSQRMPVR